MFKKILILLVLLLMVFSGKNVFAQNDLPREETLEARVEKILQEGEVQFNEVGQEKQFFQKLELMVTKGSLAGEYIIIENGNFPSVNISKYQVGDKLIITRNKNFEGNDVFLISDYIRRDPLILLFIIFVAVVLAVGKVWGITSLFGMGFSFLIIFKFILPQIINGANPIFIAIVGSFFIIPVTFYLSHGFNKKTHVAIVSTVIALIITGVLAGIFVNAAKLTGFASEEAGFLQAAKGGIVNIRGLLMAGIIIGALGILDDVTVSQASVVQQLKNASSKLSSTELYKKAMRVGQDHVSSMVNTLVLVYTGAALPLLLLFIDSPRSFSEIINYELIADEIVRTLVGSIGLVSAVPITTAIASAVLGTKEK
jgi:uncharacterized membrane protein